MTQENFLLLEIQKKKKNSVATIVTFWRGSRKQSWLQNISTLGKLFYSFYNWFDFLSVHNTDRTFQAFNVGMIIASFERIKDLEELETLDRHSIFSCFLL